MQKFITWLVVSSENPENISLTVKGILLMAVPITLTLLSQFGVHFAEDQALQFVSSSVTVLASVLSLVGLIRKLINTFSKTEVPVKLSPTKSAKKVAKKKKA